MTGVARNCPGKRSSGFNGAGGSDQPLWRFIADPETTYLYKQIFAKIRSGKSPVRIPFRCDSPECRRFMEMKLSLLAGDSIEFLSKI